MRKMNVWIVYQRFPHMKLLVGIKGIVMDQQKPLCTAFLLQNDPLLGR